MKIFLQLFPTYFLICNFGVSVLAQKLLVKFSKLFVFASFRIVRFPKFGNFSEISGFFELVKISPKKFGNKFGNKWVKNPLFEGFGVKVQKTG